MPLGKALCLLVSGLAWLGASPAAVAATVTHELLVSPGEAVPDGTAGEVFGGLGSAVLDEEGRVAFTSRTRQVSPLPSRMGYYLRDASGQLRAIARQGEPAPGVLGGVFDVLFTEPYLDDGGSVGFTARMLWGPGGVGYGNDWGIWGSDASGALVLLVRSGEPAPGLEGNFGSVSSAAFEVRGSAGVAFVNSVKDAAGTLLGHGAWTSRAIDSGISQELVLFEGDPLPGGPAGAVVRGFTTPSMNARGQLAFRVAYRTSAGVDGYALLATGPDGEWVVVAREGDPVPGAPSGSVYSGLSAQPPRLNERGELAFVGSGSVFAPDGAGGHRLVAIGGPVQPAAIQWPALNERGEVAFRGQVASETPLPPELDDAIWGPDGAGGVRLVAREGDPAPSSPGLYLRDILWPFMNVHGDVVFEAALYDGTSASANFVTKAVYFVSKAGHVIPVLRSGDLLGLRPDGTPLYATWPDLVNSNRSTNRQINDTRQIVVSTVQGIVRSSITLGDCQDGIDDDGDGAIDWDGAAAFHAGEAVAPADVQCFGDPNRSERSGCGIGGELALLLPLLSRLRSRAALARQPIC